MTYGRIVDADTIRVAGRSVRLAGLDAPELGQPATDARGRRFDAGHVVAKVLERHLEERLRQGWRARIRAEGSDRYGRALGTITLEADGGVEDVGAWLVREGLAVAEYGSQYRDLKAAARAARAGLWAGEWQRPRDYRRQAKGRRARRTPRRRRGPSILTLLMRALRWGRSLR